jgi:hypothetical protein
MGNKKSKSSSSYYFVDKVFETSEAKAKWIHDWYCDERIQRHTCDVSDKPNCDLQVTNYADKFHTKKAKPSLK